MDQLIPYQTGLCRPLDPYTRYEYVHTRVFPGDDSPISLRPLYMASDLGLLRTWVKEEYACPAWKSDIPFDEIIQTLIQTAYSDFAQVFTGVRGGEPLCEVQVFHASQDDELGSSLLVEEGDYVLRLMPGKGMPSQHRAVVETCVEYFMQYTEVKRVLAVVDEENASGNAVFRKAGFSLLTTLPSSYKMNNLYVYP